jgi:hypothetical protein
MDKPVEVVITYDPVLETWEAENPVKVYPGITAIVWKVQLAKDGYGEIYFGEAPDFQGITFDPGWPGTEPKGGPHTWTAILRDTLKPGEPPRDFHYTVNTLYQTNRAQPAMRKSWDPDVEEEPDQPPPVKPPHT